MNLHDLAMNRAISGGGGSSGGSNVLVVTIFVYMDGETGGFVVESTTHTLEQVYAALEAGKGIMLYVKDVNENNYTYLNGYEYIGSDEITAFGTFTPNGQNYAKLYWTTDEIQYEVYIA